MHVLKEVILLSILLLMAASPGRRLVRWAGIEPENGLECFVLSAGTGFALLAVILCFLGTMGFFSPLLVVLTPVLIFCFAAQEAKRCLHEAYDWARASGRALTVPCMLGICLTLFVAVNVLKALLPPHGPTDVVYYHLTLAKLFLAHGSTSVNPTFFPSFFPSNGELLFSLCLVLGGPVLASLMHFGFALLTAAGLYAYSVKYSGKEYALLPVSIFLTAPVVNSWGTMAYTCIILGFYLFLLAVLFLEHGAPGNRKTALIWGLLIGMALGLKYQALPLLGTIVAFAVAWKFRERRTFYPVLAAGLAGGILLASPWFVRNYVTTGNPFFPILGDLFPSPLMAEGANSHTDTRAAGALAAAAAVLKNDPIAPFSFLLTGAWMSDDFQRFLGPLFLGLLPFVLFIRRTPVKWEFIVLSLVLSCVVAFFLRGNVRYGIVLVILLAFLAGAVGQETLKYTIGWERRVLVGFFSLVILLYAVQNYYLMLSHGRILAAVDPQYTASFLRTYERSFRPAEIANELIPPGSKVLFHGFSRYFYFNAEPMNDDRRQASISYDDAMSGTDIRDIMRSHNITHIVHEDLVHEKKRGSIIMYGEDPRFREFMARFVERVGSANGITIYRIRY